MSGIKIEQKDIKSIKISRAFREAELNIQLSNGLYVNFSVDPKAFPDGAKYLKEKISKIADTFKDLEI